MKKTILIIIFLVSIASFSQEKKYTTYIVTDNETITSIAKKLGVTPFNLLKLNPDAKNGIEIDEILIIPNKNYKPTVSTRQITLIPQKDTIKNGILYHTVRSGETIYSLSRKYKVKKKKILKLNKLKRKSKISLGQLLKFPTNKKDTFSEKEKTNNAPKNKFFNYTVAADDTKYALARKYKISVDELEGLNPQLISKTLNEYDVIKLPIINTETQINPQISEIHTVQFQETFYSLTKHYNTTKEKLIDLNPELKNGLKEGMQIKIPKRNSKTPIIRTHLVKNKETYYSLNKLYNVTKEDLLKLNPALKDGLKEGMLLKISKKTEVTENLLNIETNFSGKKLDVVLLLPFTSIKKGKKNRIIDFYLGAIIAINDLKKKGLSVNLKVLDTKGDKATISNIINTNNFSNTAIIIGPMYYSNLEQITKTLQNNKVPIISPVATNDHSLLNAKNVIQNAVSKKQFEKRMLDFIKKNYTNQNIIIIANNEKESKLKTVKIENYLKSNSSINKVTVLNLEKGYIKSKEFKIIDKKKENWVIILDDKGASEIAVEGFKSTGINATLFALNKGDNFNNIKNSDLNKVNFHYPTTTFIDNEDINIIEFNKKYESKYSASPSNFAYRGYDAVKDALLRIATYKNINDSFQIGKTKGLISNFNYVTASESSYTNKAIFIVKYKDFEIVKVE